MRLSAIVVGLFVAHAAFPAEIAATNVPKLTELFADPAYTQLKISPDGKYFGVIVPVEGQGQLISLTSDKTKVLHRFSLRETNESIRYFRWVKDNDLVMEPASITGWNDVPTWYGDLLAASVDGKLYRFIYGYRAGEDQLGSHLKKNASIPGWGHVISDLPEDPDSILVSSTPWRTSGVSTPSVLKIRLRDARTVKVLGAPRENAEFIASPKGDVRFATAPDADLVEHIYANRNGDWQEIATNTEKKGSMNPVGLSVDGKTVFYLADSEAGVTGLYSWNTETQTRTLMYADSGDNVDTVETDPYTGEVLWVSHASDNSVHYVDPNHPISKVRKLLDNAFKGVRLSFTSITRDYKRAVFYVSSDRDPGVWYSIDTETRKANLELESNPNLSPDDMVAMQPIQLKARDGLPLAGFYTAKPRSDGTKPPLVLLVHGGPHVQDEWRFNPEVQMLATRGYAVLQVNFRGSTGYGRAFELAGRGQWGRAMQDDLTDATNWAVAQGLADPARICIMGGSYGGYASLMGVIREPKLYKCAIDMFGVTDLDEFFNGGDIPDHLSGRAYLKDAIGTDRKEWDARSPTKLADRIQAPVLIIAGGQDKRVPMAHSELMEKALKKAGKSVETLYFESEGHGFYKLEHRVEAYQKVLDFLAKHIGTGNTG